MCMNMKKMPAGDLIGIQKELDLLRKGSLRNWMNLDNLAFLLDEYELERKWGTKSGLEQIEELIMMEIDRWELGDQAEILLAAFLLERHGYQAPEPKPDLNKERR